MNYLLADSLLSYNHITGHLIWKKRPRQLFTSNRSFKSWNSKHSGNIAGSRSFVNGKPYTHITINSKVYKAHRIAYLLFYKKHPVGEIDHINGDGEDNTIINLRTCDRSTNAKNKKLYKTSSTGISGVRRISENKWRVYMCINGKEKCLGTFTDFLEACCARKRGEFVNGYHINHGQ